MNNLKLLFIILIFYLFFILNSSNSTLLHFLQLDISGTGQLLSVIISVFVVLKSPIDKSIAKIIYTIFFVTYFTIILTYGFIFNKSIFDNFSKIIIEYIILSGVFVVSYAFSLTLSNAVEVKEVFNAVKLKNRLEPLDSIINNVNDEMKRSLRYDYPVGIISIKIDENSFNEAKEKIKIELNKQTYSLYLKNKIGLLLSKLTRSSDIIIENNSDNHFYVICPQTEEGSIELLVHKFIKSLNNNLDLKVNCGTASFPKDSVNIDDLLALADKNKAQVAGLTSREKKPQTQPEVFTE